MSKSRVFASAMFAAGLVIAGLSAGPAFADDPPPLVWTDPAGFPIVTSDYTAGLKIAETMVDPFGYETSYADPLKVWNPYFFNTSNETLVIGLGIDLSEEGVVEPLWEESSWGIFSEETLHESFRIEVASGEPMPDVGSSGLPQWPGHTAAIFLLDESQDPVVVSEIFHYTAPGGFVPINMDQRQAHADYLPTVGQELTVAGSAAGAQVFAGVVATATAPGLPPGEELELWIAPNFDFFFFHLLGAVLPSDARKVGSGLVAANGTLTADFEIPADVVLNIDDVTGLQIPTPYQLIAGVRADDYWPTGTWGAFDVLPLADLESGSTPISEGAQSAAVTLESALVELGALDGLPAMDFTATVSAVGPSISGFQLAGSAPRYFHLSSTAPLTGPVELCITYDPLEITGPPPRLFHFEEVSPGTRGWVDITFAQSEGQVCGFTSSFSPFALGYPDEFDFTGFFSPVSMTGENLAKPGQAIPVKFSLNGDQGLDVVTSAHFVVEGTDTTPEGQLIPATTTEGNGLSYSASSDQYTYVWKTAKTLSLKTGRFELTLSDGTVHTFDVTFKK